MTFSTIYWASTGEILCCRDGGALAPGEASIPGEFSSTTHYVKEGVAVQMPPPVQGMVFDHLLERWVAVAGQDTRALLAKRDRLLADSDWTQLSDVPSATRTIWRTYRQALRDLTTQTGYPLRVIWPVAPA